MTDVIIKSQKVEHLKVIRDVFYDLLINQVPSLCIIEEITKQVICKANNKHISLEVIRLSNDIQSQLQQGDKELIYLESFICNLMCLFEQN